MKPSHAKSKLFLGALAVGLAAATFSAPVLSQDENAAAPQLQRSEGLDLHSLEERLRETKAIPGLKKLGLKTEIDNLLARFRIAHAGGRPDVLALREPYDGLILKIHGMLKQDPQLAQDIVASKEAIWARLADREKFASVN